ncbi:TPA: hypothetical protein L4577_005974, partial [Pseudomonas aeruginosa]|nr:hypothetical protein [Pseudomonas aeruginosa]
MKRIFVLSLSAFLVLAGCHSGEKSNATDKKEENKQASKTNDSNKEKQDNKNENKSTSVTQLSEKKKLALAFYADEADQYMLTKNEILTGIYEYKKGSEVEKKQMEDLMLEKVDSIKNAPDGMKFYQVYPT